MIDIADQITRVCMKLHIEDTEDARNIDHTCTELGIVRGIFKDNDYVVESTFNLYSDGTLPEFRINSKGEFYIYMPDSVIVLKECTDIIRKFCSTLDARMAINMIFDNVERLQIENYAICKYVYQQ